MAYLYLLIKKKRSLVICLNTNSGNYEQIDELAFNASKMIAIIFILIFESHTKPLMLMEARMLYKTLKMPIEKIRLIAAWYITLRNIMNWLRLFFFEGGPECLTEIGPVHRQEHNTKLMQNRKRIKR